MYLEVSIIILRMYMCNETMLFLIYISSLFSLIHFYYEVMLLIAHCFAIGYTAGKKYNQNGGGSDSICLPEDPTWLNYTDGLDTFPRAIVYGTEIDVNEPSHVFPYHVNEQDIPCVVCMVKASVTLMIPGRGNCYDGWSTEYNGYLMTGYHGNHGSYDHICVDFEPEFIPNGQIINDQHILYLVEAHCGSLPCPPYVEGREVACVVCSK